MNFEHKDNNFVRKAQPAWASEREYTYDDYLTWQDGKRYEIIDGVVYNMSPVPHRRHQKVFGELHRQFANYLLEKECEIYAAPFDVRLPKDEEADKDIKTVIQPDLVVVCDLKKLDERGCKGVPDLVIEVISPFSEHRDRKIKRGLYEKAGVKEYWLIDYMEKTVEIYLLNERGEYDKPMVYTEIDKVPVGICTDLNIDLLLVFKD
jgi:Uma2 family endonuclease